jgi:hypothetical protein
MANDQAPMTNDSGPDPAVVIGIWSLVIPFVTSCLRGNEFHA